MKRGQDRQIEIPASTLSSKVCLIFFSAVVWLDNINLVEVERRYSCAVVACDPFPGTAVIALSPWSRRSSRAVRLHQRWSDAHKSSPLLDNAATCHVKHELQNGEDPKLGSQSPWLQGFCYCSHGRTSNGALELDTQVLWESERMVCSADFWYKTAGMNILSLVIK